MYPKIAKLQRALWRIGYLTWRSKFLLVPAVICIVIFYIYKHHPSPNPREPLDSPDAYLRDVPESLYKKVLDQWYNFSNDASGFNAENVHYWGKDLLKEVRRKWIINRYNPSKPYNLYEPETIDTSMGQAKRVREILQHQRNGFFIECGAFDGETRSNTLNFERFYNWTGLLIEADPINFTKMLQKNRRAYLSPTCLSTKKFPMVASFLMAKNIGRLHNPHSVNDSDDSHNEEVSNNDVAYDGQHTSVQCFPLATYILALGVKRIDYFSLDIEGQEIDVLETIPFNDLNIRVLSVEYIHNTRSRDYMIELMENWGYVKDSIVTHADNLANDVIFVKKEMVHAKK